MCYYIPIYAYGVDRFLAEAKQAGVDGLIVVDLPPEEDEELCLPALATGLSFIRLATPTTDDKRLPAVLANTSGFVYYVSMTGVTGAEISNRGAVGDAVPGRAFYDVFAGTGVNGIEAISRGAAAAVFLERDTRLIGDMTEHFKRFEIQPMTRIVRTDVYRWIERWEAPPEPICVFLSPPFVDLQRRRSDMLQLITALQEKVAPGSVVVLQSERCPMLEALPDRASWDERRYGRNHLLFWVKPQQEPLPQPAEAPSCPPE